MNGSGPTIVAAGILGACIVGAAMLLSSSIDRVGVGLDTLHASTNAIRNVLEETGGRPSQAAAAAPAPRRRGPDPARVYKVNLEGSPTKGPETAEVTLVEFSDFQCPFCQRVNPTFDRIEKEYGDSVRVVFKHLPLSMHSKAPAAHAASEAAHKQGKFWEMHDKIFANQRALSESNYDKWAAEIGLDVEQFKKDRKDPAIKKRVDRDAAEAQALGVTGTPAFFINGKFFSGAQPFEAFQGRIEAALEG